LKPAPQAFHDGLAPVFSTLLEAVNQRRKVFLRYDSIADKGVIEIELSPYRLLYSRRAWYVVGESSLHNQTRTFKLSRMLQAKPLAKKYLVEEPFDPEEHFGLAWSIIPEGKIHNIELRFLPKVARNVADVLWHPTQQIEWQPDGSIIYSVRVDGLGEISWWILGYGDQVEVLKPAALRKRIARTIDKMADLYAES
jgi:proteasome accessory factor B